MASVQFSKFLDTDIDSLNFMSVVTKYFDLGTTANKVVLIELQVNIIKHPTTDSEVFLNTFYRQAPNDDWIEMISYSTGDIGDESNISIPFHTKPTVKGVQLAIELWTFGTRVDFNDFNLIYRTKRDYNVLELS